jgi:hypothetical protein
MMTEYGALGGMRVGRGNRSTSAPVTLCPPKIPYDLTLERTRAATFAMLHL